MSRSLLDWLIAKHPTAKRQTLRRMVQARRVVINGVPAKNVQQMVRDDDTVEVVSSKLEVRPPGKQLNIVFEDADILVVHKPPGLLTSTVPKEPRPTLLARVSEYLENSSPKSRVGLIHRLDRDAAGLLIFSKNDLAYRSLKIQFFEHSVLREYVAVVHGEPKPARDRITSHLVERTDGTVHSTRQRNRGELAITDYEVIERWEARSLVQVTLQTGKKHQIRVHLSEKGSPIVGDLLYGRENDKAPRLLLLARRLGIAHPRTGRPMIFELPLPRQFKRS